MVSLNFMTDILFSLVVAVNQAQLDHADCLDQWAHKARADPKVHEVQLDSADTPVPRDLLAHRAKIATWRKLG